MRAVRTIVIALFAFLFVFAPMAHADDPNPVVVVGLPPQPVPQLTAEQWAGLQRWIDIQNWVAAVNLRLFYEHILAAPHRADWERVARCETGGNWRAKGSRFSGGVGFANTTWNAYGGRRYAANAGDATEDQQILVADRIANPAGLDLHGCRGW